MILNKFIFPLVTLVLLSSVVSCREHIDVQKANAALDERLDNSATDTDGDGVVQGFAKVSVGTYNSCAIYFGALYCWGSNNFGGVGDGTTTPVSTPVKVIDEGVTDVSVGFAHVCAVVDGGLFCWGDDTDGQVGDNACGSIIEPCEIISSGVKKVSAGLSNTCAVLDTGALKCWGANGSGQIGDNSTTPTSTPTEVIASGVSDVSTGSATTCAVVRGALYCWGDNSVGQYGNNTTVDSLIPLKTISHSVRSVSVSILNSMTCVKTSTSGLNCFGDNSSYQIGDGTTDLHITPYRLFTANVTSVSATAAPCVAVDGSLRCWGPSSHVDVEDNLPTKIVASGVASISTGEYHSCYVTTSLTLFCYGHNTNSLDGGLLGTGTENAVFAEFPVQIFIPN